jgi:hypothetical protein
VWATKVYEASFTKRGELIWKLVKQLHCMDDGKVLQRDPPDRSIQLAQLWAKSQGLEFRWVVKQNQPVPDDKPHEFERFWKEITPEEKRDPERQSPPPIDEDLAYREFLTRRVTAALLENLDEVLEVMFLEWRAQPRNGIEFIFLRGGKLDQAFNAARTEAESLKKKQGRHQE